MDDENSFENLRSLASKSCKNIDIGTAVLPKPLFEETEIACNTIDCLIKTEEHNITEYARIVSSEFNAIVVEHHLKWQPLCETLPGPIDEETPSKRPGRYDFSHCDRMVDWAISKGMKIKGHVLVWHVTTPDFVQSMSSDEIKEQLKRHIFTTMAHFRDRIKVWDVVNESLAPDGTLAHNIFLEKLGEGYIEQCFRWAHEADPTAFLIYNDNKVEGMNGPNKDKADGFYNLLKGLVEKGVPIHGAGMQAHFNAAGSCNRQRVPTPFQVKSQIHRIGELGLKVNISELDVRISKLSATEEVKTLAQCQIYHDIVAAALTEPAFDGIWLWGFSDRHTWVKNFYYDDSPLIFDEHYQRKPAYFALRDAIGTLTLGGTVGGNVYLNQEDKEWGKDWRPKEEKEEYNSYKGDHRPDWLQS